LARDAQITPCVKALLHAVSLHAKGRQILSQQNRESGALLHKCIAQKQGDPVCIFDSKWIVFAQFRKRAERFAGSRGGRDKVS
jgi:hypothetical protein